MSAQNTPHRPQDQVEIPSLTADSALDRLDVRILAALQANARLSNQLLSEHIRLSPSATLQRVRRLEARRLIRTYRAEIDIERLRPALFVFAEVTLSSQYPQDFERFEAVIADIPEIVSADQISGPFDYVLQAVVADVNAWRELADYLLSAEVGAAKITTSVRMKAAKRFAGFPLSR